MSKGISELRGRWPLRLLLAVCLFWVAPASAGDPQPPREPFLMIDSGGHTALVRAFVFTRDGRYLVSGADDKVVRVWDWRAGRTERRIFVPAAEGEFGKVYALALSPDDRLLAVASDARPHCDRDCIVIRIYDFATGALVRALRDPHANPVLALDFSPDGARLLAAGISGLAAIWNVETGAVAAKLEGHDENIYTAAYMPDGRRVVTCSDDMTLRIWDADSGALIRRLSDGEGTDQRMALSPSGRLAASGDDSGRIRVWNTETGEKIRDIGPMAGVIGALVFDADEQTLAVGRVTRGEDEPPTVWRLSDGARLRSYARQTATINFARRAPEPGLVATGDIDGAIHIWSVVTGEQRQVLAGVGRTVRAVELSDDGDALSWGQGARGLLKTIMTLPHGPSWWRTGLGAPRPRIFSAYTDGLNTRATTREHPALTLRVQRGGVYNFENRLEIRDGDTTLAAIERDNADGFRHTVYGFAPDGRTVLSGGDNGFLEDYTLAGKRLGGFVGHTTSVWALSAARDELLASGAADQTIRLWSRTTHALIATLFYGVDGSWAMWTPQGYYAASPNGAARVGWLMNDDLDRTPRFLRADELKGLARPDLVEGSILARRPVDTAANGAEPLAVRLRKALGR